MDMGMGPHPDDHAFFMGGGLPGDENGPYSDEGGMGDDEEGEGGGVDGGDVGVGGGGAGVVPGGVMGGEGGPMGGFPDVFEAERSMGRGMRRDRPEGLGPDQRPEI